MTQDTGIKDRENMKYEFKVEIIQIFKMSFGWDFIVCGFICEPNRFRPNVFYDVKIIVEDVLELKLNQVSENVLSPYRVRDTSSLGTPDNLDVILPFIGKKKVFIEGLFSEGQMPKRERWQKSRWLDCRQKE